MDPREIEQRFVTRATTPTADVTASTTRSQPSRWAGPHWNSTSHDLPAGFWWQPVRLALGMASVLGLARFAYGLLVPAMRSELHWSLAQAGGLTAANSLGYLLGAVAAAPIARRLGLAASFRLGMVLTAVALAVTGTTTGYTLLILTRAATGVTGALVFITGGTIASQAAARARSALPLTICFSGAGLGIALSGTLIPPLLSHHPGRWPIAWGGMALAAGLATAASWKAPNGSGAAGAITGFIDLRGVARLWQSAAAYLLFGVGYIAYITFLSAYLATHRTGVLQVGLTWASLGCAAIVAPMLWSRPITTWPGTRALAVLLGLLAGASALALAWTTPAAAIGSAIIYGATFLGVPAAITTLIREAVPPARWAGIIAAFTVVFAAGQTAGPYLAGALADRFGTGATLAWTAALCAAGAAFSLAACLRAPTGRAHKESA